MPSSDQPYTNTANPPISGNDVHTSHEQYKSLLHQSASQLLVFRIHDLTSGNRIQWTGNPSTSGFSSLNPNLAQLTPSAYQRVTKHHYGERWWATGVWLRGSMIDHILCRRPLPTDISRRGREANRATDEVSPWISTSRRLDWVIWEIARRLALGGEARKVVRMAVIRQRQEPDPYDPELESNLDGSRSRDIPEERRELCCQPWGYLAHYESGILSEKKRHDAMEAKRRTAESYETLYYGRVFSTSIEADLIWTAEQLPFELPAKFWRPTMTRSQNLAGWLDRLRWDPRCDSWEKAEWAMKQFLPMSTGYEDQPVHGFGGKWPQEIDRSLESWG